MYVKTGKVRFGYQHFAFLGEESQWAAEASECAAEQDAFWAYHDLLFFDKYGGENRGAFSKDNLKQFAAELGLDTEAFNACLDSGKYAELVRNETAFVQSLGVRGTPTFVVNGRAMSGALPFETFQQVIEEALSKPLAGPQTTDPNTGSTSPSQGAAAETSSAGGSIATQPGEAVSIQGNEHVEPGQPHPEYNSDPPTSGWHLGTAIPAGFYDEPQPDEALVHNLEHGHVVIAYDCSKLTDCETVKSKLKALVERYDGWKVTVVPRANKDTPLALTAWGRIDRLGDYDEARITAFIDAYRDQGPEKTPE